MKKILMMIIICILCLSMYPILAPKTYAYVTKVLLVNNPGTFGETWYLPNGTSFTLMSFLRDKGYFIDIWTDISGGRALTLDILSSYDVVILPSWFFDISDHLQYQGALFDYVNQGGGLLFAGQSGLANTLDESLGFQYIDGGYVDASIVDSSHPIMQGISELPKAGGVFVDWDNVIADNPLPSNVAILARTTDPSNRIALIAFELGQGRVVAGPSDGLLRPYGPTAIDPWDVISEPVIENKLLINAISWVARRSVATDISAQYSSFVSAFNNYKKIFGQDVVIGQTVDRTLSGVVNDPPAHYQWHSWEGQTYPNMDGFSIRIETIEADYVYKIIGMGHMGGSQPSASGWVQVNSPFKVEQINFVENVTYDGGSYVRIYVNSGTGRIDFSAQWYNWPALIDAPAFNFAITIAKAGGTLPPFSYDTTRTQAAYDYDTDEKRVVMLGGFTHWIGSYNPDIWTFDLLTSQWTYVSAGSGPSGRYAASLSYNPVANNFLIFGGGTLSGEVSDTWKFQFTGPDAGTWTQIAVAGHSVRAGAPMVFDSKNNLFVLFGGERYVYSLDETWVFDPSTNVWSNKNPSPSPSQRARAAMAYDAKSGKVLLFGGLNKGIGSLLGDTWLYDAATNIWQQVVTATVPSARQFPSLACDGNGVFYLFGGWRVDAGGGLGQYLDDTWKFDMATMQWMQLFPSESPIAQSQAALMHIGSGKFVLMGGWRDSPLGEVWFYDSNQNTWTTTWTPPAPLPLSASISPLSASILVGQSVPFTSTVSGGTPPYSYQWYLNGTPVSGATSSTWTFTPTTTGHYSVYLNVTDSISQTVKSNEASVTVAPPLSVSIAPTSASILLGQSVTFTSTVSGGYAPYSYQWYLNGDPVSGATLNTWTFAPTAGGIYYVQLKVTDAKTNTAQSETARIIAATVPVGGYSFPIQVHARTEPVLPYIALIAILTAVFTKLRPKTKRKR